MKHSRFAFFLVVIIGVLGVSDLALAWGPATHIGISQQVLTQLGLLPSAIAAILARYGAAYLYGSIAADVVFAKRMSKVKQFCHHWSTAFRMLQTAETDEHKAFAYGYLSHLAADTVAHGKYVPRQIIASESSVNFGHLYWELRADGLACEPSWTALDQILRTNQSTHHMLLGQHITDTLLPFTMNRMLFHGMNALTVRQSFRRTLGTAGRLSRFPLSTNMLDSYQNECVDRIQAILTDGASSSLLREDPNGTSALMQIRVNRREAKQMRIRGNMAHRRLRETSSSLAPFQRPYLQRAKVIADPSQPTIIAP